MTFDDIIRKRRTVRKFQQKEIDRSDLLSLVDAARLAPSASNLQRLRYLIIETPETVAEIFKLTLWAGFVKPRRTPQLGISAPKAFIVVTGPEFDKASPVLHADAGAAIQNMLLKAVDLDLGACWIGSVDKTKAEKVLSLAEDVSILYLVALGYPDEFPVTEDISIDKVNHYYLDDSDLLHVPKYRLEDIVQWS